MLRLVEADDEALNLVSKPLRHIGMNEDWRFLRLGDERLQLDLARLQAVNLVPDQRRIDAVLDRFDKLGDALLGSIKLRFIGVQRGIVLAADAVHVFGVFAAKHLAELGIHQALAQRAEDRLLQLPLADGEPVMAGALVACGRASVLRGRHLRDAAATFPALQQERKKLLRPALHGRLAHAVERCLLRLGTLPKIIVDDAKVRHVRPDPFRLVVESAVFAAGVGVLRELLFIPALLADVERVAQDAGMALTVAVDGAGAPCPAVPRGDAFRVQFECDLLRRFAVAIVGEDAAHDRSLLLVHLSNAADAAPPLLVPAGLYVVAVAQAPSALALQRAVLEAAIGPAREILDEPIRHAAFHRHVKGGDLAFHECDDADAPMGQSLVHGGDVGQIAAQPIDRFRHDDIERLVL